MRYMNKFINLTFLFNPNWLSRFFQPPEKLQEVKTPPLLKGFLMQSVWLKTAVYSYFTAVGSAVA